MDGETWSLNLTHHDSSIRGVHRTDAVVVPAVAGTPGADSGSYGQGIPPIQPGQILGKTGTDSAIMSGVEEGVAFRTNLGLCEVWGESATVRISVMDSSMTELGQRDYDLRAYENIQINQVAMAVAGSGSLTNGIVRVTVVAGTVRIGAYLSVVDNTTGDPTYIAISPQTPAGG